MKIDSDKLRTLQKAIKYGKEKMLERRRRVVRDIEAKLKKARLP